MLGNPDIERTFGRRAFLQEKRRQVRLFEVMLLAVGTLGLAALPLAWLSHGFDGVGGAWTLLNFGLFAVLAQWPGHFRRKWERQLADYDETLTKIASSFHDADRD
jgi:hypothetical protein